MDAAISSALQQERFEWISKAPLSVIKALREGNRLEYMRGVIRKGITDLKARKGEDLLEV